MVTVFRTLKVPCRWRGTCREKHRCRAPIPPMPQGLGERRPGRRSAGRRREGRACRSVALGTAIGSGPTGPVAEASGQSIVLGKITRSFMLDEVNLGNLAETAVGRSSVRRSRFLTARRRSRRDQTRVPALEPPGSLTQKCWPGITFLNTGECSVQDRRCPGTRPSAGVCRYRGSAG